MNIAVNPPVVGTYRYVAKQGSSPWLPVPPSHLRASPSGPRACTTERRAKYPSRFTDTCTEVLHLHKVLNPRYCPPHTCYCVIDWLQVPLVVAWNLVRSARFRPLSCVYRSWRAGPAAIKAGHPRHATSVMQLEAPVDACRTLEAVAGHLDLEGLQSVWEQLDRCWTGSRLPTGARRPSAEEPALLRCSLFMSAGRSRVAAADKLEWLLSVASDRGRLCLSYQVQRQVGCSSGVCGGGRWQRAACPC